MNKEECTSIAEAQLALKSITKIENATNVFLRAPLWLNFIISCSYGMGVFSWASTRHDNLWMLGVIISAIVFVLAVALYLYSNRLLGIKPKVLPKSKSENIFGLLSALFFGIVIVVTRIASENGIWWASYTGALVAALALAYIMHIYPSGDFKAGMNRDE